MSGFVVWVGASALTFVWLVILAAGCDWLLVLWLVVCWLR